MNKNEAREYMKKVEDLNFGYVKIMKSIISREQRELIVY